MWVLILYLTVIFDVKWLWNSRSSSYVQFGRAEDHTDFLNPCCLPPVVMNFALSPLFSRTWLGTHPLFLSTAVKIAKFHSVQIDLEVSSVLCVKFHDPAVWGLNRDSWVMYLCLQSGVQIQSCKSREVQRSAIAAEHFPITLKLIFPFRETIHWKAVTNLSRRWMD